MNRPDGLLPEGLFNFPGSRSFPISTIALALGPIHKTREPALPSREKCYYLPETLFPVAPKPVPGITDPARNAYPF